MLNSLAGAIAFLQSGDLDNARRKLEQALERTDGCALRGSPDSGGGGSHPPAKDYVKTCAEQNSVYPPLRSALDALLP
jgi:hypothetical protein